MTVLISLAVVVATLGFLAYMSKRRFGTLGLALAAGFLIAESTASYITGLLMDEGVSFGVISLQTIVTMVIILTPSFLLLFGGPTYASKRSRLIGSLLYALLALAFGLGALGYSLVLIGQERVVYETIWIYREQTIVLLLCLAMIDMFMTHNMSRAK
jgi:hypothetical protein